MLTACTAQQPFVDKPTGTAAGFGKLAHRILASILLAASLPDTIPALLHSITTQRHPTVSAFLHTVQHNLGYTAQPTLADVLAATDTIARCARHLHGPEAYAAPTTAIDDVEHSLTKPRHAADRASVNPHESALARQLLDGLTNPTTEADQCTIVELAATYVPQSRQTPDPAKLLCIAALPLRTLLR